MLSSNLDSKSSRTPADFVNTEALEQHHANSFSLCHLAVTVLRWWFVLAAGLQPQNVCQGTGHTWVNGPAESRALRQQTSSLSLKARRHSPEFLCCIERRTGCLPSEVWCHGSDLQVNIWELVCFQPYEQSGWACPGRADLCRVPTPLLLSSLCPSLPVITCLHWTFAHILSLRFGFFSHTWISLHFSWLKIFFLAMSKTFLNLFTQFTRTLLLLRIWPICTDK